MATKALVMVVDDDRRIRELVRAVLSRQGHEIIEAADGEEALGLLDETWPDLIVLDVAMPRMDGRQLAEEVRKRDPILPLIVVTGLRDVDTVIEMMRTGVYDFIAKPFTAEHLTSSVATALEGQQMRRQGLGLYWEQFKRTSGQRCREPEATGRETAGGNDT